MSVAVIYPSLLKTSARHFWQATLRSLQLLPGFSVGSADQKDLCEEEQCWKGLHSCRNQNILMPYATRNHTKQPKVVHQIINPDNACHETMLFSSSLFLSSKLCRASASETRNVLSACQQKVHVGYIREGLQMNFKYNDFSKLSKWSFRINLPLRNARNHGFPEPNVGLKMAGPLEVHHCHERWGFSSPVSGGVESASKSLEMVTGCFHVIPPLQSSPPGGPSTHIFENPKALQGRFILLQFVLPDLSCLTQRHWTIKRI